MGEPLVRCEEATRVFGQGRAAVAAVADATCEVRAGEWIALVGPSGSGKTTLLHLLAGLDAPTTGTVSWPALGPRDRLRPGPVAVAFQGPSLLPPLSVVENVALPMLLAGEPEPDATGAAWTALELFGVADVGDRLPEDLSGGQSQRAGLARAIAGSPTMLLADEPTGQLDRALGSATMGALTSWAESSGAALVVATHDTAVADQLRVRWAMEGGRLRAGANLRSL